MSETWVTEPPISEQGYASGKALARKLKRQIEAWSGGSGTSPASAIDICDAIIGNTKLDDITSGNYVLHAYLYSGEPIALMLWAPRRRGHGYIADIVSHPGALRGGPTMLEYALNYLRNKGLSEKLFLHSLNKESTDRYIGMGFKSQEPSNTNNPPMELDPRGNTKWQDVGGRWRYVPSQLKPGEQPSWGEKYGKPLHALT
jgi:hypothetical protein